MSTYIFDPLTGEPTLLATARSKRPDQTSAVSTIAPTPTDKPKEKVDFFAKGNEHMTPPTLYVDQDDWNVRVFENKFPLMPNHEIIVSTPYLDKDIDDMPAEQTVKVIRAWLNRVQHYNDQDMEVFIFNNRGGKAGASLDHPHSQLVAAKAFPGYMETEKEAGLRYFNEHDESYWVVEIRQEQEYQKRIIHESSHFLLYVPYACRWSYEMRLIPKAHRPNIGGMDEAEIQDFARMLKGALNCYNALFDRPDRNFWIHTARHEPFHWHLGFLPHIKVFGALEMGAGIWVSDKATSEDAAAQLKEHFVYET